MKNLVYLLVFVSMITIGHVEYSLLENTMGKPISGV